MDNKIPEKRVRKTGFTLIELLVTIAILSIIFVAGFFTINGLFGNSEDKVNKITKKMIINAAEQYAIEFKDSVDWEEEEKESGEVTFCVSLDSLINYGYFKQNDEKVKKYRNDYIVKMNVVNGVIDYKLVEKTSPEASSCVYYEYDTSIVKNNEEIKIIENEKEIGSFNYDITKYENSNDKYMTNINLKFDFQSIESESGKPPYITLLVDGSGSMYDNNKYENAKKAAIDLSIDILNKIPDAKISLVLYATFPIVMRDFSSEILDVSDFDFDFTGYSDTNVSGALDYVSSRYYWKSYDSDYESNNFYTVLLFDGLPNVYSFMLYSDSVYMYMKKTAGYIPVTYFNGDYNSYFIDPLNIGNDVNRLRWYLVYSSKNVRYKIENLFYKNNSKAGNVSAGGCPYIGSANTSCTWWSANNSNCFSAVSMDCSNYVIKSSDILKNIDDNLNKIDTSRNLDFNSKLMVIGYDMSSVDSYLKTMASQDSELCSDGYLGKYCYYASTSANISSIFGKLGQQIINVEKSIMADEIIFRLIPAKLGSSEDLFYIKEKDGTDVEGNKIEIIISDISSWESSRVIDINNSYDFVFNNKIGSECIDNNCDYISLFEKIEIELKYENGGSTINEIVSPTVSISSKLIETTN